MHSRRMKHLILRRICGFVGGNVDKGLRLLRLQSIYVKIDCGDKLRSVCTINRSILQPFTAGSYLISSS